MTARCQFFLLILLSITLTPARGQEEKWADHWAFQKLQSLDPESVTGNPVDFFIQSRLQEAGAKQNSAADPHTLLRRITLDLTGLPPTREEISDFLEKSPASEKDWQAQVKRLLASPHYGERWGRHWLDVARYVQGTIKVPGIDQIDLAEAYRDYVVRSFNQDKPYDQFIREQLAGDLLPESAEGFDPLIATAFLSIGPWFDECTDPNKLRLDIIDEQISTTTKAFLAMDFACSRCHDHKFDPIPTRDYYALAGIFRSTEITSRFSEFWRNGRPRLTTELATEASLQKNRKLDQEIEKKKQERWEVLKKAGPNPVRSSTQQGIVIVEAEDFDGIKNLRITQSDEIPSPYLETRRALDQWTKYFVTLPEAGEYNIWARFASKKPAPVVLEINGQPQDTAVLSQPTFGTSAEHFRWSVLGTYPLKKGRNPIRLKVDRHRPFPLLDALAFQPAHNASSTGEKFVPSMRSDTIAQRESFLSKEKKRRLAEIADSIAKLEGEKDEFPVALTIREADQMQDLSILPGGMPSKTKGDPIPREVPSIGGLQVPVPLDQSGRLQLAEWLSHPENPLTARVMVNRIWHWHFGEGLVRTTDDFGMQGAPPTHPRLLDYLAREFIESGWSIKHIHRLILYSQTYRISSQPRPENQLADPGGKLFSRYPRRRLEVEAIYDGMLASIGKVARQPGGQDLDTSKSKDRALYILTSSRSPMGMGLEIRKMFPLFGFDPSGRPIHQRDASITPGQSLWWLNNPLPHYYAKKLAELLLKDFANEKERITAAHEIILGHPPTPDEIEQWQAYLAPAPDAESEPSVSEQERWTRACLALFSTERFSHLE